MTWALWPPDWCSSAMSDPGECLGCQILIFMIIFVWVFFYKGFPWHILDEPGNLPVREPLGQDRQDKCKPVAEKALYRPGLKHTLPCWVLLSASCPGIAVLKPSQWSSATLPILSFWPEGAELFLVSHLRGTRMGLAALGGDKLSGLALCCPLYLQMQLSLHHPILQPPPLSHIPLSSSITKTNSQNSKEHERAWKMTMEGKEKD